MFIRSDSELKWIWWKKWQKSRILRKTYSTRTWLPHQAHSKAILKFSYQFRGSDKIHEFEWGQKTNGNSGENMCFFVSKTNCLYQNRHSWLNSIYTSNTERRYRIGTDSEILNRMNRWNQMLLLWTTIWWIES